MTKELVIKDIWSTMFSNFIFAFIAGSDWFSSASFSLFLTQHRETTRFINANFPLALLSLVSQLSIVCFDTHACQF